MTRAKDISKIITDADFSGTLDVTGDLSVDNATLKVDSTNNRVGISTSSMTSKFEVAVSDNTSIQEAITIKGTQGGAYGGYLGWKDNWSGDSYTGYRGAIIADVPSANTGRLRFFTANSSTLSEKMRINANGQLLLGTTTSRGKFTIGVDSSSADGLYLDNANGGATMDLALLGSGYNAHGANAGEIWFYSPDNINIGGATGNTNSIKFLGGGAERMRITSSGNVGIGTSSPEGLIHSFGGESGGLTANSNANGLVIENDGHAGISIITPASSNGNIYFGDGGSVNTGYIRYDHTADALKLKAQTDILFLGVGSAEKARIEADTGNLLVGKTANDIATVGHRLGGGGSYASHSRANEPALYVNRNSSDGFVIGIQKDGADVGSIGSNGSTRIYIGTFTGSQPAGIRFVSQSIPYVAPCNSNGAASDNLQDLGAPSERWDDVYATNGTIQTSDRNEKQDIEELSEAEQRVAVVAKGLMRKFRWKDKVAEKGDNARTHFGIIAQDLQDAFTAEGLDAGDYAMFTSNTWWELDGETYNTEEEAPEGATQKTRLGVRYNQLLAFIISAI